MADWIDREEIENAVRSSSSHKAPGPDGFNAHFYKVYWPIIGADVCEASSNFFKEGRVLQQIKNTFIVFIPKSDHA